MSEHRIAALNRLGANMAECVRCGTTFDATVRIDNDERTLTMFEWGPKTSGQQQYRYCSVECERAARKEKPHG